MNACASLLIEAAFADKIFSETEVDSLKFTLVNKFDFNENDVNQLIEEAENIVEESTSLYEHTRLINDKSSYEDKLRLINSLWKIAYADNEIDKYEDHLIRKISNLLHVSHKDFISEKIKVKESRH
ncbi:MAG: TerB family tellurite resistance protein [Gammaproteobacteria bacterium]